MDQNEMVNRMNYYQFQHGGQMQMNAMNMRDQALRDAQYGQALTAGGTAGGALAQYYASQPQGWDSYGSDLSRK
jgi:hypothetical protein